MTNKPEYDLKKDERKPDEKKKPVVCGTCGREIKGEVHYNRWGPCHLFCQPIPE